MYISFLIIAILFFVAILFFNRPDFGKNPRGGRLERIKQSPHYRDGQFQNNLPTVTMTSGKSPVSLFYDFLFHKVKDLRPETDLPVVKTDLIQIGRDQDVAVWLGHSSLFLHSGGKRFLIDPVLMAASPVSCFNKPFKGTSIYRPDDIPDIDYLLITHDHYDHLDYKTVKQLKSRTGTVICPLGVGEHFEHWGFDKHKIIELDWNENTSLKGGFIVYCLPARHFSGRGLIPNKTLWASFMLQTPSQNIYISGDGGYDTHFADIAGQFGRIDFAVLENGQYNEDWKLIHLLPGDLVQAVNDLHPTRLMTVHNSKYALAKHAWYEPLDKISEVAAGDSLNLITPMIGEAIYLKDNTHVYGQWWRKVK